MCMLASFFIRTRFAFDMSKGILPPLLLQPDSIETRRVGKPWTVKCRATHIMNAVVCCCDNKKRLWVSESKRIAQQFYVTSDAIVCERKKNFSRSFLPLQWILMLLWSCASSFFFASSNAKYIFYDIWSPCRSKCERRRGKKTSVEWEPLFRLNWFFWCCRTRCCFKGFFCCFGRRVLRGRRKVVKHNFPGKSKTESNLSRVEREKRRLNDREAEKLRSIFMVSAEITM